MINKVKLPHEVAEAIKRVRSLGASDFKIINRIDRNHGMNGFDAVMRCLESVIDKCEVSVNDLMIALVNGYEIEKTPEEMLREYYEDTCNKTERNFSYENGIKYGEIRGIVTTLYILGIKIEGVNV